jgi:EcsC protein family
MTEIETVERGGRHGITNAALEQLIRVGVIEPERVLAAASQRGLSIEGETAAQQLHSLQRHPVARLDHLANSFARSTTTMAAGKGFMSGLGGLPAMVLTIPADIAASAVLVARVTSAVRSSYGFTDDTEEGALELQLGMLAALGIERISQRGGEVLVDQASRMLVLEVVKRGAGTYAVDLATREVVPLTLRATLTQLAARALVSPRAVPVAGAFFGSASSAVLMRTMGKRVRKHYRDLLLEVKANTG